MDNVPAHGRLGWGRSVGLCASPNRPLCMEVPARYVLLVRWATLEDHTAGFRQSPACCITSTIRFRWSSTLRSCSAVWKCEQRGERYPRTLPSMQGICYIPWEINAREDGRVIAGMTLAVLHGGPNGGTIDGLWLPASSDPVAGTRSARWGPRRLRAARANGVDQ